MSKIDEAAVNATIKTEMDRINNSLAKITQCLNVNINHYNLYRVLVHRATL